MQLGIDKSKHKISGEDSKGCVESRWTSRDSSTFSNCSLRSLRKEDTGHLESTSRMNTAARDYEFVLLLFRKSCYSELAQQVDINTLDRRVNLLVEFTKENSTQTEATAVEERLFRPVTITI